MRRWTRKTLVSEWADRYGPLIGFLHLGLAMMAIDMGGRILRGGSPISPEVYGPLVYSVPALVWVGLQLFGSLVCVIGALAGGKIRTGCFIIGGASSAFLFTAFTIMASGASQGIVLETGTQWFATPFCIVTSMAGWGAVRVRRRSKG